MAMNAFPYPGNKARHSDWILSHLPEHDCYVELFGGAAGVLFNKPRSKIEVYNDLNGDIPHFFRVLRDRCEDLQEWIRNVPYSREVYNEWADSYYDGYRPEDDIERAGRFFALRHMQFGGKIENKAGYAINRRAKAASPAKRFRRNSEDLTQFRDRLRDVNIEALDWVEVLDKYDGPQTVFYADPPYVGAEDKYSLNGFDHDELAREARSTSGHILVSYDSRPDIYGDSFNVSSTNGNFAIGGNGKDATEYLIMNYDPNDTTMFSEAKQTILGK